MGTEEREVLPLARQRLTDDDKRLLAGPQFPDRIFRPKELLLKPDLEPGQTRASARIDAGPTVATVNDLKSRRRR